MRLAEGKNRPWRLYRLVFILINTATASVGISDKPQSDEVLLWRLRTVVQRCHATHTPA
jgi:hypothetical protein